MAGLANDFFGVLDVLGEICILVVCCLFHCCFQWVKSVLLFCS